MHISEDIGKTMDSHGADCAYLISGYLFRRGTGHTSEQKRPKSLLIFSLHSPASG